MMDISRYQGINQFGKAYAAMLRNDPHALGSVDRVLAERMVRICVDTAEYLYTRHTSTSVEYTDGLPSGA